MYVYIYIIFLSCSVTVLFATSIQYKRKYSTSFSTYATDKVLFSTCFTTVIVFTDVGPVRFDTCRISIFLKIFFRLNDICVH